MSRPYVKTDIVTTPAASVPKPLCAITGASGYVGGRIKKHFESCGWEVIELTRRARPGTRSATFELGRPLASGALRNVQALVHCAYDFRPLRWADIRLANVKGTQLLLETAKSAAVQRVVCISSISAYEGCRSLYGQAKLEIEQLAATAGALAIRPGLVYGDNPGGIFGRLVEQIRRSSVLPIAGDGSQIQYMVHDEDLAAVAVRFAEGNFAAPNRPITAAHDKPWTFREVLREIGMRVDRQPKLIPIPWRMIWAPLKMAEMCGCPLGFRSDSLVSLMHQNPRPDFSPPADFGFVFRPFDVAKVRFK